jgi:hypothetical protein
MKELQLIHNRLANPKYQIQVTISIKQEFLNATKWLRV